MQGDQPPRFVQDEEFPGELSAEPGAVPGRPAPLVTVTQMSTSEH